MEIIIANDLQCLWVSYALTLARVVLLDYENMKIIGGVKRNMTAEDT